MHDKSISSNAENVNIEERLLRIEQKLDGKSEKSSGSEEIDIRELIEVIWKSKWIIALLASPFAVAAVIFSLMLGNIYKSTVLLAPSQEAQGGGMSALADQFGGLASLAGIALPNKGESKVTTSIEIIQSRQFIANLIEKYDMLVPLMAAKGWDREADQLIIDSDVYDEAEKQWIRDVSPPKEPKPSMWEAYKALKKALVVTRDKANGLVSIEIEHFSPKIAQEWVQNIVREINFVMKEKDVDEARKSIRYLNIQLEKTSVADMRSIFYQLIEEQSKIVMLAEVRDEYIFSVIDPPVVAEEKNRPNRALICILGSAVGVALSLIFVLIRYVLLIKPR